jgi:hypothetical protein
MERTRSSIPSMERYTRQLSLGVSVVVSLLRSAFSALLTFLGPSWDGPARKYRPERHYMRGPGPKWREKQYKSASAT